MFETKTLRSEINRLEMQLTPENRNYMGKLKTYMILASFFHNEEEVSGELLLPIYQDVLAAQEDGLGAEDYLGKDTKTMADELLSQLPPLKWYYGLRMILLLYFPYLGWDLMSEFGFEGRVTIEPFGMLYDLILVVLLPMLAFLILKNLIYSSSKIRAILFYVSFGLAFVLGIVGRFWLLNSLTGLILPIWISLLLVVLCGLSVYLYRKEGLVGYFFPTYLYYLICGLAKLFLDGLSISQTHWIWWLHLGLVAVGGILFLIGTTIYMVVKKK